MVWEELDSEVFELLPYEEGRRFFLCCREELSLSLTGEVTPLFLLLQHSSLSELRESGGGIGIDARHCHRRSKDLVAKGFRWKAVFLLWNDLVPSSDPFALGTGKEL